jgi:hypothetical protein
MLTLTGSAESNATNDPFRVAEKIIDYSGSMGFTHGYPMKNAPSGLKTLLKCVTVFMKRHTKPFRSYLQTSNDGIVARRSADSLP